MLCVRARMSTSIDGGAKPKRSSKAGLADPLSRRRKLSAALKPPFRKLPAASATVEPNQGTGKGNPGRLVNPAVFESTLKPEIVASSPLAADETCPLAPSAELLTLLPERKAIPAAGGRSPPNLTQDAEMKSSSCAKPTPSVGSLFRWYSSNSSMTFQVVYAKWRRSKRRTLLPRMRGRSGVM